MSGLSEDVVRLIELALAKRTPLTLTLSEVRELAAAHGIRDPREIHEPVIVARTMGRGFVSADDANQQPPHGSGS